MMNAAAGLRAGAVTMPFLRSTSPFGLRTSSMNRGSTRSPAVGERGERGHQLERDHVRGAQEARRVRRNQRISYAQECAISTTRHADLLSEGHRGPVRRDAKGLAQAEGPVGRELPVRRRVVRRKLGGIEQRGDRHPRLHGRRPRRTP